MGCYDGSLIGFDVDDEGLQQSFGFSAHLGCVKAVAMPQGGKILVSGGVDETIRIFDLQRGCAMGTLYEHKGSITCLKFVNQKYLLSGGSDGVLIIWRVKDWEPLHSFKAHQASVVDISSHPSGRMALSIGRDNQLRLWDLMNGSCAVTKKMEDPLEGVQWAPTTGTRFAVLGRDKFLIADLISADTQFRKWFSVPNATCMYFASDVCLLVGNSKGEVIVFDVRPEVGYKELHRHKGHNGRVKSISPAGEGVFCSMGGDGGISVWTVTQNIVDEDSLEVEFEGPLNADDVKLALSVEGPREGGKDDGAPMARVTSVCTNGFDWIPPISFQTTSSASSSKKPQKNSKKKYYSDNTISDDEIFAEEMSQAEVDHALKRAGGKSAQTPKSLSKKAKLLQKKSKKLNSMSVPKKSKKSQKMSGVQSVGKQAVFLNSKKKKKDPQFASKKNKKMKKSQA